MKHLLIVIIMTLSTASFAAATKTEIIEEEVCNAVAGCWINPSTGECPDCVIETRKIVTVIEDREFKEVESIEPLIITKTSSKMCFFPKLGKERDCDWKERGKRTAAAVKRGIIECGGMMKWEWTDVHHSEFICKG